MATKLYVGGLSFSTTEDELRTLFEEIGQVESVAVITDRYSGRSRGFGFVEMVSQEEAQKAIEQLNGREVGDRNIVVNEARPRR
ncbi:MAG: RNA-binding protein [Dehalococcoidia bacterium]